MVYGQSSMVLGLWSLGERLKAFSVAWRALVSFYNDFFFLAGMSLLWWATGGVLAGAALGAGWMLLRSGGPWWLAPLLAIPAGPASAAMANVARRAARDLHVDRTDYLEGLRRYWRQALALSAISMAILALLLLNIVFYASRGSALLVALAFFWGYLTVFWMGVLLYLYPVLVGLDAPTISGALRIAVAMAFAKPIFSLVLLILAAVLTGISVVLAVTLFAAWPAVMVLLGEHSVSFLVQTATRKSQ
jgi:uncharacterized membrane protein YesL